VHWGGSARTPWHLHDQLQRASGRRSIIPTVVSRAATRRPPGQPSQRRAAVGETAIDAPSAGIPTAAGRRPAVTTMSHRLLLRFCATGIYSLSVIWRHRWCCPVDNWSSQFPGQPVSLAIRDEPVSPAIRRESAVPAVSVSASSARAQPTPTDPGHASAWVRDWCPSPSRGQPVTTRAMPWSD
jgi:hypothetical protein